LVSVSVIYFKFVEKALALLVEKTTIHFNKYMLYNEKLEGSEYTWMKKLYKIYRAMLIME